ncbi:MAG: 50S ribosomal protein L18e [Candidatus Hodarchaeales archaeon]
MKATGRTDPNKISLIRFIKQNGIKNNATIWKKLSEELSVSNRNRAMVNLSHINRVTKSGEEIVIPGKVLGAGVLSHKLNIAAENFSSSAREKITAAGGQCLSFEEIITKNPKGANVRLLK